jgi:uncharacterized phiE125 gp8 family phage protein
MKNYGIRKLTVTSPVQTLVEPLTAAEVKAYLKIPVYSPVDAAADALLETLISAAREQAEAFQNRPLVGAQYDLTLDEFPACEIELADSLNIVDLVKYKDEDGVETTLAEGTDYTVNLVRGLIVPYPGKDWPSASLWPSGAVTIRFTVDPPAIDKTIKAGMLRLIQTMHDFGGLLPNNAAIDHAFNEKLLKLGGKPVVV